MALVAAAIVLLAPGPAAAAASTKWRGQPTGLAGRSQMSKGELIYTDYLYDDFGPDLDGSDNETVYRPANQDSVSGDYRYPSAPRYAGDAADLRELRLRRDSGGLHARVALQTIVDASVPIATIAVDADGDRSTGSGVWPGGAGTTTPGADRFITVWGGGASWTAGDSTKALAERTNLAANTFDVTVPHGLVGKLDGKAKVWVGVGLSAGNGSYVRPSAGHTALYDVGFQGAEAYSPSSSWGDARQSAALASGSLNGFSGRFDAAASKQGADRPYKLKPGYYNRIFRSKFSYGEGIRLDPGSVTGGSSPEFLGRYQPYGLYVPPGYSPRHKQPLLLFLHALNKNQNLYASVAPDSYAQLGADRHSLVITPLARATDGWYLRSGLIDVMEAWDDADSAFSTDPSHTSIVGYSMGGYGAYRMGLLMPDRFARAAVYVGPPVFAYWNYPKPPLTPEADWVVPGNTSLLVDNALDLPYEMSYGGKDTIVPASGGSHQADLFRAAGNPYRYYQYPEADHFGLVVQDEWTHTQRWLGTSRRIRNPVRVRYVRYPAMDIPDADLRFDRAYWVSRIAVRSASEAGDHGEVDAVTRGLGEREPALVDEPPRAYEPPAGELAATVTGQHFGPAPRSARKNSFRVGLKNVKGVRLKLQRMGLDPRHALRATLHGDGQTSLTLAGHWRAKPRATLDGERVAVHKGRHRLRLNLELKAGQGHHLRIKPH